MVKKKKKTPPGGAKGAAFLFAFVWPHLLSHITYHSYNWISFIIIKRFLLFRCGWTRCGWSHVAELTGFAGFAGRTLRSFRLVDFQIDARVIARPDYPE